jgi:hypothetical protein
METHRTNRPARYFKAAALSVLLIAVLVGFMKQWEIWVTQHEKTISEWPNVSGTVISTHRGTIGSEDTPTITIRFAYMVEGMTYQDSQCLIVDDYSEESKYPLGTSITVYYDPAKPENALINLRQDIPFWAVLPVYLVPAAIIGLIYIWTRSPPGK